MRAITVSVDMADLASITLPYNRKHFSDIMVVTTPKDTKTIEVAKANNCSVYTTNSFYANNARFNKWKALEEALTAFGRRCVKQEDNWLCLLDIDILWPKSLRVEHTGKDNPSITYNTLSSFFVQYLDELCSPLRRMMIDLPIPFTKERIPDESTWSNFKVHRNVKEWAGYSQVFNTYDQHLLMNPPWHRVDFTHAGIADSLFQDRWPLAKKVRPNFQVLHLGMAGLNWLGRSSDYLDGEKNPAKERLEAEIQALWVERRRRERVFRGEPEKIFLPEKIKESRNK